MIRAPHRSFIVLAVAASLALAGCGQKGPLRLPQPEPQRQPQPEPAKPATP